ncbi:MAG TPA: ubiquinol-cytochrome C chaperone family protein, partial [Novosphingobium sp.]|nr:ubiquinol-cytochrome C chaperone family protein [Novosphingobium sp.]
RPDWYTSCGIADSLPGRFDAITLVLALVLLRLETEAGQTEAGVRLTELFVEDMDGQLREAGVGDLVVGKHIGRLMSVLGGRLGAYRAGLAEADDAELHAALTRNVTLTEGSAPQALAAATRQLATALAALPAERLLAGEMPA